MKVLERVIERRLRKIVRIILTVCSLDLIIIIIIIMSSMPVRLQMKTLGGGRPFHTIKLFCRNKAMWDMHGREESIVSM